MPYWHAIKRGVHLGYRKLSGKAGTWWVRRYIGNRSYQLEPVGAADDFNDADGAAILDFWQAQERASTIMVGHAQAGTRAPLTVRKAVEAYVEWLESNRRTASDARYRARAFIYPEFGDLEVNSLMKTRIEKWLADMASAPARLRTKTGKDQKYRKPPSDEEAVRRRRSTANRTLTVLRAALNRAWKNSEETGVVSDSAWRKVEPFTDVDAQRPGHLTVAEAQRLVNACAPDFRAIVQAGLLTGARYGQLAGLRVTDFNPDSGTVTMRSRKGRGREKIYDVVLTDEGLAFFKRACAGRQASEIIFPRADGERWGKGHQTRAVQEACKAAKISPVGLYEATRHTYASLAIMKGTNLLVVAQNLGHSDTRMVEKHYGHLAPSFKADAIRQGAPRFGFKLDKVATLG